MYSIFGKLVLSLALVTTFVSSFSFSDLSERIFKKEIERGFSEPTGYALPLMFDGLQQSPINVLTTKCSSGPSTSFSIHRGPGKVVGVSQLKGALSLKLQTDLVFELNGKQYSLIQGHFHTPSEHQWVIPTMVLEGSEAQIAAINQAEGDNARHIHARFSRTVEFK